MTVAREPHRIGDSGVRGRSWGNNIGGDNVLRRHLLAIMVLVFGSAVASYAADRTPEQAFQAGVVAMEGADWRGAADAFGEAAKLDPNLEVGQYYLGLSLYHLKDWSGAEAALERAISLKESRAGSRLALAKALLSEGKWQEAEADLKQEISLEAPATQAEATYVLGLAYAAGDDSWNALREFTEALQDEPNFIDVYFAEGDLYYSQGRYRDAMTAYLKCKALIEAWREDLRSALAKLVEGHRKADTTEEKVQQKYDFVERFVHERAGWPKVSKVLGDTSLKLGEYEDARNYYRHALNRTKDGNPNDTDALTRIGNAYLTQAMSFVAEGFVFKPGKYLEAAVTQFQRVLDVDPSYAQAYEGIGLAYLRGAQIYRAAMTTATAPHTVQEAVEQLQLALEADPKYLPARIDLGNAYLFDKRNQEALKEFETALTTATEQGDGESIAEAQTGIAKAKAALGDPEAARAAAESAVKSDPLFADAYVEYGRALFLLGRHEEAAQQTQKAVELAPGNLSAHILLGDIYYEQAFWGGAVSQYEQALALARQSVSEEAARKQGELQRKTGECYLGQGDSETAVTYFNKALAGNASDYQAERDLGRAYWTLRQYPAARKALEIAASLAPSLPEEADAYFEMGALLEATGDVHEAYLNYSTAARLDPTNQKAQEAMERLRAG